MTCAPPLLTDELYYAIMDAYWNNVRGFLSPKLYGYWAGRYQPIEDEE